MTWDELRASYDTVAAEYERRFLDELAGKPRDRELLAAFAGSVGDPILEIGCGPGQVGAFVRGHGRRVVGLDLSVEMTRVARRRLDAAVAGDMRQLPVRSDSWGGLVAFYSVIHVRRGEVGAVLEEFRRVVRPGGQVLLSAHEGQGEVEVTSFLDQGVPFVATLFELDELVAAGQAAGLEVTRAERRPPYPNEGSTVRLYVEARRPGALS